MENWEYRAFDCENRVQEGIEEAESFLLLALKLRQNGLQVISATKLNPNHKLAITRLNTMKKMINGPSKRHGDKIRRSWIEIIMSYVRHKII